MTGFEDGSTTFWLTIIGQRTVRESHCCGPKFSCDWPTRMEPETQIFFKVDYTRLLYTGKLHCTSELLFTCLGRFNQASKFVDNFNVTELLNPNQSNRRLATQWYFPFMKYVVFHKTRLLLYCEVWHYVRIEYYKFYSRLRLIWMSL